MSSILRALKKLEEGEESRERDPGDEKITMRRVINRKTGGVRRINPMIFALLSVLGLGVAVGIFINSGNRAGVETKRIDTTPKRVAAEVKPDPKPVPSAAQPVRLEEPVKPVQQKETPVVIPFAAPVVQAPVEEHLPVKPKIPSFVLSGILWSDNPERRVAVINDKFLKEGEVINGAVVVGIDKNSVTMKSGHETWSLKMNK